MTDNRAQNWRHAARHMFVTAALATGVMTTGLTSCNDQTTRAPAQTRLAPAETPARVLAQPEAEHGETFTSIRGVRELRDGRVLVLDELERSVQILDFGSGGSERVGRSGKGPGEYTLPVALIPLAGDSSGIVDEAA